MARAGDGVHLRPRREQDVAQINDSLAVGVRRQVQPRVPAEHVASVHVRALTHQEPHGLGLAIQSGVVERSLTVLANGVKVGPVIQEQPRAVYLVLAHGGHQWRPTIAVASFDLSPTPQQGHDPVLIATRRRVVQFTPSSHLFVTVYPSRLPVYQFCQNYTCPPRSWPVGRFDTRLRRHLHAFGMMW